MARRRARSTRTHSSAPRSQQSLTGPLLVGGAVLAGVYFLSRRSSAATTTTPAVPTGPITGGMQTGEVPSTTVPLPPGTRVIPAAPVAPPSPTVTNPLQARLAGSADARRIYYVQAVAYSTGWGEMVPDGIEGPITAGIVREINRVAGFPNAPERVTDDVVQRAVLWANTRTISRVVPDRLPQVLIDAINATARGASAQAPLLQAQAA